VIVDDDQRLAMEFIATVNRGGYRPTAHEINEWRLRREAKPARRGKLLEPEVPGTPDRRVRVGGTSVLDGLLGSSVFKDYGLISESLSKQLLGYNAAQFAGLSASVGQMAANILSANNMLGLSGVEYKMIPGTPGTPAVYAPDKPPEKFLAHLRRLGWIERNSQKRYSVTELGHALLSADVDGAEQENSSVIVLSKDDELAYAEVLGAIGECGNALVVDAYLSAEALNDIILHTEATRFLVDHKFQPKKITQLSVLVGTAKPNADGVVRELRQADYHDRYLIGDHKTYSLTASLNGVGKSTALLYEMPETAARAIRTEVNDVWDTAKVLTRGLEPIDVETEESRPARQLTRDEDGRFRHDGCETRHQSRRTARNCKKGT
jgi:hypothetical protein